MCGSTGGPGHDEGHRRLKGVGERERIKGKRGGNEKRMRKKKIMNEEKEVKVKNEKRRGKRRKRMRKEITNAT